MVHRWEIRIMCNEESQEFPALQGCTTRSRGARYLAIGGAERARSARHVLATIVRVNQKKALDQGWFVFYRGGKTYSIAWLLGVSIGGYIQ